ncbi:MAG: hypothetical protein K0Q58_927, partial [Microbacterium sp.]|nr:hypothetical protein [Microbacterium sp.]
MLAAGGCACFSLSPGALRESGSRTPGKEGRAPDAGTTICAMSHTEDALSGDGRNET